MSLDLRKRVIEYLILEAGKKHTARDIASWIFEEHRDECEEKRRRSRQNLSVDADLIQQIVAEISAVRPQIEKIDSKVKTTETRPRLYYYTKETEEQEVAGAEWIGEATSIQTIGSVAEYELYPLLARYLHVEHQVHCKRIDEKRSSNKNGPNANKWLYPDLVGLEYIGSEWDEEVKKCVRESSDKQIRLWSFEVKRIINRSNIRESWLQTVSNSSWANIGYLVAAEIRSDVIRELRMLAGSHGIGVIRLDAENPEESEILIPARERSSVDWDGCNRLILENRDFRALIENVRQFYQTANIRPVDWMPGSFA